SAAAPRSGDAPRGDGALRRGRARVDGADRQGGARGAPRRLPARSRGGGGGGQRGERPGAEDPATRGAQARARIRHGARREDDARLRRARGAAGRIAGIEAQRAIRVMRSRTSITKASGMITKTAIDATSIRRSIVQARNASPPWLTSCCTQRTAKAGTKMSG